MDAIAIIPESAPFNADQRAWLNGFLAGWLGLQGQGQGHTNGHGDVAALTSPQVPLSEPAPEPWHDPSLALDDRLRLAEAEPLPRRLMAAMAQLDCGACGYVCRTYSEAIASGAENCLTLCTPGGSETARALKRIVKAEAPGKKGTTAVTAPVPAPASASTLEVKSPGWSRENPYTARIVRTENLNRPGSEKETRHVEIDLGEDGPSYAVGDSLGIYPANCDALVDDMIAALGAVGDEPVAEPIGGGAATTLREALMHGTCLSAIPEPLLECLAEAATDAEDARQLRLLIDDDTPIAGYDVLDVLGRFPSARPTPAAFVAALALAKPRLYSISSSPKRHAGQVHLTVRRVAYEFNGRTRKGVASTMLADRVAPGAPLRVFVQKSHGFTLPADHDAPAIMIGPGTGIAPFRAFLHERDAVGARGKNWLVFGDQRRSHDFLYEDELSRFLDRGLLTRLDTAFSRDGDEKVYVQHRLREQGAELFRWLESGAHVYVCGDARRMARDVDQALREVIREHGRRDESEATAYLAALAAAGRYSRDVY